jgi:HSP20 family protein
MELVRWKPAREMFSLQHKMNDFFDDFLFPMDVGETVGRAWRWNPKVDIYEEADHIVLKAELPGVDKKDIEVDVKNGVLTLKGERSVENEVKEENYHRKERSFGRFERSFKLEGDVDADKITADYKDGILKVSIPKPEEIKPKQITVH